jgi:hypothetical protein
MPHPQLKEILFLALSQPMRAVAKSQFVEAIPAKG